jgi:hypothetical protein
MVKLNSTSTKSIFYFILFFRWFHLFKSVGMQPVRSRLIISVVVLTEKNGEWLCITLLQSHLSRLSVYIGLVVSLVSTEWLVGTEVGLANLLINFYAIAVVDFYHKILCSCIINRTYLSARLREAFILLFLRTRNGTRPLISRAKGSELIYLKK